MKKLYTGQRAKYSQLIEIERRKIEAYWNEGKSISLMSRELNRSKSTISCEIRQQ